MYAGITAFAVYVAATSYHDYAEESHLPQPTSPVITKTGNLSKAQVKALDASVAHQAKRMIALTTYYDESDQKKTPGASIVESDSGKQQLVMEGPAYPGWKGPSADDYKVTFRSAPKDTSLGSVKAFLEKDPDFVEVDDNYIDIEKGIMTLEHKKGHVDIATEIPVMGVTKADTSTFVNLEAATAYENAQVVAFGVTDSNNSVGFRDSVSS